MIHIDYKDARPIFEQISSRIENLILHGIYEPDSQLPSVRNLAMELSINPNTIQKAYTELERKGYIYSIKGRGNFVSDTSKLYEEKRKETIDAIAELVTKACSLGIEQQELIEVIKKHYENRGEKDD
ncbi:MAG: GntR family transcriptional regulator [Clostridium sp.]|nr:GntR family transcriptional regulator [Clostridium sp.]